MNNKPIILLLEENELNIAALYSLYAQKIPSKKKFWDKISNDEIAHAASIGNKKSYSNEIEENKFSRGVTKYVMDFVVEESDFAKTNNVSHHDALKTALRIERSMLEKKCFNMFAPKDEKLKTILLKLNNETERHIQMLLKEMKKNNFGLE